MENLLPFLLGLLFLGVKYYNKTQKDKAKKQNLSNPEQAQSTSVKSSLDDFIEQFYSNTQTTFETPIVQQAEPQAEEDENWMEQKHQEEPSSIEYTTETAQKRKKKTQFEMIQNKPTENTERLDFDLRKAIIYDAIINPPYI